MYHSKGIDESYPKMYFLLNFNHCVKRSWHFCQILTFLTMPAHQIWSCHVTQDANLEIFLFCSNSTFNIRKGHKISCGKALYVKSYQPKTSRGVVENTLTIQINFYNHMKLKLQKIPYYRYNDPNYHNFKRLLLGVCV